MSPSTKTAVSASPAGVARALLASKVKTPRDPTITCYGTPPSRLTGPHPHAPWDPTLTCHGTQP